MTTIGQLASSPTNYTPDDADDLYSHLAAIDTALTTAQNRVGQIVIWPTEDVPSWLLVCDGSSVSREAYPDLFDKIGTIYGASNGSSFNLPKMNNGFFVKVHDNGAGVDALASTRLNRGDGTTGDNVGTDDYDRELIHSHGMNQTTNTTTGGGASRVTGTGTAVNTAAQGGNESRPINIAVNFCIVWGAG